MQPVKREIAWADVPFISRLYALAELAKALAERLVHIGDDHDGVLVVLGDDGLEHLDLALVENDKEHGALLAGPLAARLNAGDAALEAVEDVVRDFLVALGDDKGGALAVACLYAPRACTEGGRW